MPEQMSQDDQNALLTQMILDKYQEKKDKGIITFVDEDGNAVLVHKQFDQFGKEVDQPLKMRLSSANMARLRIDSNNRKNALELQKIALQEKIDQIDAQETRVFSALEADVKAFELQIKDGGGEKLASAAQEKK